MLNDSATGTEWTLTRNHIVDLLRPAPRLAVLNACRSGAVDDVRALTDAFLSRDAVAIVGMHGNISGSSAGRFGGVLYRKIADEQPIDRAVTLARRAVFAEVGVANQQRDWFLPVLTCSVHPAEVLTTKCGITGPDAGGVTQKLQPLTGLFVDRVVERRRLVRGIDPDPEECRAPVRLQVVTGVHEIGKSKLVHWIRRRCALRGRRVRYVGLRGDRTVDAVGALAAIMNTGDDVPAMVGPVSQDAFARFDHDLAYVLEGKIPIEPNGAPLRRAPAVPERLSDGPANLLEVVFESFLRALTLSASERPMVLILDDLDGMQAEACKQQLHPLFIRQVLDGAVPGLTLVVVLSEEQYQSYWPAEHLNPREWINVDRTPPDLYEALAEDIVLTMDLDVSESHLKHIELTKLKVQGPWLLKQLADFATIAESL